MRNWLAVGAVLGMIGSVVAGCGSSSGPSTAADFCAQLAAAECPQVVLSCATTSEPACEQAVSARCNTSANTYQTMEGRAYQPGNVQACLGAISGVYGALSAKSGVNVIAWTNLNGSGGTTAPTPGSPLDLCDQVFLGNAQTEASCTSSYDCASGDICGSNGACGPESDVSEGGECGNAGDLCTGGDVCTQEGRFSKCTSGGTAGATCNSSAPCGSAFECVDKKCVALKGEGATCKSNSDCDPTGSAG